MTPPDPQPQSPEQIAPTQLTGPWVLFCTEGIDPVFCQTPEDVRIALRDGIFPGCAALSAEDEAMFESEFDTLMRDKILRFEGDPPVELLDVRPSASLEARAVKAEHALTAANAATSAMREELEELRQDHDSEQRGREEAERLCVTAEKTIATIRADRDAWQRRAQENEAGMAALEERNEALTKERDNWHKLFVEACEFEDELIKLIAVRDRQDSYDGTDRDRIIEHIARLQADRDALAQRVSELEADKARLDWLDAADTFSYGRIVSVPERALLCSHILSIGLSKRPRVSARDLRSAIDAARNTTTAATGQP